MMMVLRFKSTGRSFFSLYFLIISSFILFSWLLDNVWNSYLEQDIESYTGYKTMLQAVGDYALKHPEDEWHKIVQRAAKRYKLPLKLISLKTFDVIGHEDHNALNSESTHVYFYVDKVILHYLIPNTDAVITLGPVDMPTRLKLKQYTGW